MENISDLQINTCDECKSDYFAHTSEMMGMCPECAHVIYGYENCRHHFVEGRCEKCYWDGSASKYIKHVKRMEASFMKKQWKAIQWIFKPDGALRDIYVENVSMEDWKVLMDHLNTHYTLKYGPTGDNKIDNKIDTDYAIQLLNDKMGEMDSKMVSILIDNIMINTHFFSTTEIEFDIEPREIITEVEYWKVLEFMNDISRLLNKPIILTGDNQIDFPLIRVDYSKELVKALTKKEAESLWK